MEVLPLIFAATFGIGIVAGLVHLVIGIGRPRSPVHLAFAAFSTLFALLALFTSAMIQADTLDEYIIWYKYAFAPCTAAGAISLLWFVAHYTGIRPTPYLVARSLVALALVSLNFFFPTGILADVSAIRRVTVAWGEEITLHWGATTAWQPLIIVMLLLDFSFFIYAFYRQWRRGERMTVLLLALPLTVFILTTTVHDRLVDAGVIASPYLAAVSMLALSVPLSLKLAHEAVRTKRALSVSEQELRAFVTHTEEGIWTVEFDQPLPLDLSVAQRMEHIRRYANRISNSNDAMAHILGYDNQNELIGRRFFDVFSLSLPENVTLLERAVSAGFGLAGLVGPAVDKEGAIRYVEGSLTPILHDGHVVRVWGASRDVTEKLRLAEELRRHREELADLVEARTAELEQTNEQLSWELAERRQAEKVLVEREALLSQVLDLLPVGVWMNDATGQIMVGNPAGIRIWGGDRQRLGDHKGWWVDTGERVPATEWAGARAISRGETTIGEFLEIEAFDTVRRFIMNSAVPLRGEQQEIVGAIIVNEDVTALRQIELELQRRVQELSALHEIAEMLATLSDLIPGLQRVAGTVTALFAADSTHIVLTQRAGEELTVVGFDRMRGPLGPTQVNLTLADAPLTRQVLEERRTLVVTGESRATTTAQARAFLKSRNIKSFMAVPLSIAGATVGVLSVNSGEADRAFPAEEVQLAETIAGDIAAAVANLHLLERVQETAVLEERQRIAGDLHDSVTQTLYSVSIMAQTLPRLLQEQRYADAGHTAEQMRRITVGTLAQMRTLLFELRPEALAQTTLPVLLQQLGDILTGQLQLPVDLVVRGDDQLPADVKIACYRIAQEAFNNIVKHAAATQVTVTLRLSAGAAELKVFDNGRGFDPAVATPGRMGIRIMTERAEAIGARLQVDSQPGQGTEMALSWRGQGAV